MKILKIILLCFLCPPLAGILINSIKEQLKGNEKMKHKHNLKYNKTLETYICNECSAEFIKTNKGMVLIND